MVIKDAWILRIISLLREMIVMVIRCENENIFSFWKIKPNSPSLNVSNKELESIPGTELFQSSFDLFESQKASCGQK